MPKPGYSEPQIYPTDRHDRDLSTEWYIGFRYTCPIRQKRLPFQVRLGINYYDTHKAREAEGRTIITLVDQCLKEGWNPFECEIKEYLQVQQAEQLKAQEEAAKKKANDPRYFGLNDALQWAYDKKDLKERSRPAMECCLKFAKQAAIDLGIDKMPIKEVTRFYVRELLDRMKVNRQADYDKSENKRYKGKKFTPNNYNRYLAGLSAHFFELEDRDIIEYNPCHKITKKDPIDFGIHRHPSEKELAIIKKELPKLHPGLYDLLRFEYVTGMRPDEILDVKFSMVDYLNSCINISDNPYNEEGELISKTTAYRQVPLPQFLLDWIQVKSRDHDPDTYIFSLRFQPGSHRMTVAWVGMLWKRLVIEGLGINVSFYSFKGLGGEAKREAGIDTVAVSAGYGHTTTAMAQRVYLKKEGDRLRQQVIELAPDL